MITTQRAFTLMKLLEGEIFTAEDCPLGFRSVGLGFNMERAGAKQLWTQLKIVEDFDEVYYKRIPISKETALILFDYVWGICVKRATKRAKETFNIDIEDLSEMHQFILPGIVYNCGNIRKWSKVFTATDPKVILFEALRNPKEMMNSRVARIGKFFEIIKSQSDIDSCNIDFVDWYRL